MGKKESSPIKTWAEWNRRITKLLEVTSKKEAIQHINNIIVM